MTGRALARNGAVTLDTNNVSIGQCAAVAPVPALGSVGLMILMALLAVAGVLAIKRLTS